MSWLLADLSGQALAALGFLHELRDRSSKEIWQLSEPMMLEWLMRWCMQHPSAHPRIIFRSCRMPRQLRKPCSQPASEAIMASKSALVPRPTSLPFATIVEPVRVISMFARLVFWQSSKTALLVASRVACDTLVAQQYFDGGISHLGWLCKAVLERHAVHMIFKRQSGSPYRRAFDFTKFIVWGWQRSQCWFV